MKTHYRLRSFLIIASSSLLSSSLIHAATGTWNVDANGLWGTAGNWTPGIADGAGFIANFTNNITADRTVSLDSDRTINRVNFSDSDISSAGSWILSNNGVSTNNLILSGTTGAASGTVPVIDVGALGTGKTATISAVIEGSYGFTKTSGGTLTLTGNNTLTGAVTINANGGTVSAGHNNALGTGTVSINSNTSLEIQDGITINNALTATDQGNAKNLRLKDGASSATYSGTISILETTPTNFDINVATGGTLTISGIISGNSFEKVGAGTVILTGANTYGLTTITTGIVDFANKAAKPAGTATAGVNGSVGLGVKASDAAYYSAADVGNLFNTNTLTGFSLNAASGVAIDTTNAGADFDQTVALTAGRALTKLGTGTLILSQTNTYTGNTTLSAGTLSLGNGGTTGRLSATTAIAIGATGNLTINRSDAFTQATDLGAGVAITGTGSFTQAGAGTTTLTAANTYTGATTIKKGTLALDGAADRLAVAGAVVLGDTSTTGKLVLGGTTTASQTLTALTTTGLGGSVVGGNAANSTLTLNIASSNTFAGNLGGAGTNENNLALTKIGSGTLILSSANTYTGATTISAGTLQIGAGGTIGSLSASSAITNNSALSFNHTNTLTQGTDFGTISGTGTLTQAGSGTLILSSANTYSGTTTVSAGALNLKNSTGLGATAGGTSVTSGAELQLQGGITVGAEALTLSGTGIGTTGALLNVSGTNTYGGDITRAADTTIGSTAGLLTLSGTMVGNFATTFAGAGNITGSGVISGTAGITKTGAGTLTLSGANTYTGATTVSAGKLAVNGSTSASSAVGVSSGGTLAGSGTVGGNASIASGGTLAPGNSPGVLNIAGTTTLNSGSMFEWEIDTAQSSPETNRGVAYDGINTTALVGADAIFKIMLTGTQDFTDAFWNQTRTWTDIFKSANGSTNLSDWASVFSGGFQYSYNGQNVVPTTQGSFTITGNSLSWSAVPEPSNAVLGLFAATALLRRRRNS